MGRTLAQMIKWKPTTKATLCSPWLRPGDYTVYTYSKDTSGVVPARDMVVLQSVTIESNTQTVTLDTLTVFDNI